MRTSSRLLACLVLVLLSCKPPVETTPPPASAPAELSALAGASVLIAAGDIGSCQSGGDELTAMLVDSLLVADSVAGVEDVVATLGDNAYPNATDADFANCFRPSWGDTSKRIMQRIRPSPGNHEHYVERAAPYYRYFGRRAGDPGKGYYSYDLGEWHMIALNSEILVNSEFLPEDRSAQEDWLANDLRSSRKKCTLVYFHHPRFSSGWHGSDIRVDNWWKIMYRGGVDVVLNGHDHHYERFLPIDTTGTLDTLRGIVQFVVGTGGVALRGVRTIVSHSAARVIGHWGVLKLTLGSEGYRFAFLEPGGRVWDPGGGMCH